MRQGEELTWGVRAYVGGDRWAVLQPCQVWDLGSVWGQRGRKCGSGRRAEQGARGVEVRTYIGGDEWAVLQLRQVWGVGNVWAGIWGWVLTPQEVDSSTRWSR